MIRAGWRTPATDWLLRCYFNEQFTSMVTASDAFDWVESTLGRERGGGPRPGGEQRGNATDRRRRKTWLLITFGDGEMCACHACGRVLTFETLTVDRIVPGALGGRYVHANIRPACRPCNCAGGSSAAAARAYVSAGQEFMGE